MFIPVLNKSIQHRGAADNFVILILSYFLPSRHSFRDLQSSALLAGHTRQFVRGSGASPTLTSTWWYCKRIQHSMNRKSKLCTLCCVLFLSTGITTTLSSRWWSSGYSSTNKKIHQIKRHQAKWWLLYEYSRRRCSRKGIICLKYDSRWKKTHKEKYDVTEDYYFVESNVKLPKEFLKNPKRNTMFLNSFHMKSGKKFIKLVSSMD